MKRWLLLLPLILAACVPSASDPYTMSAYGQSLQRAADAQILATQQAAALERERVAMQAQGTQSAWNMQATQTVSAQYAEQTAGAIAASATAGAVAATQQAAAIQATQTVESMHTTATAQSVNATAVAINLAVDYERELREKQIVWVGAREAIWTLFSFALAIMVGIGLWRGVPLLAEWVIEWRDRRNSVMETRQGTIAWVLSDGELRPMLLSDIYHNRPRPMLDAPSAAPEVTLSANAVSATSPVSKSRQDTRPLLQMQAIQLLKKCDQDSDQIIPCAKSGLSEENWIQITDALVGAGLVDKVPGVGTRVIDGYCRDVLFALELNTVKLPPTPPRYTAS